MTIVENFEMFRNQGLIQYDVTKPPSLKSCDLVSLIQAPNYRFETEDL